MDARTILRICTSGGTEEVFPAISEGEKATIDARFDELTEKYFPPLPDHVSLPGGGGNSKGAIIMDENVETAATSDYVARVHYESVPDVPLLLARHIGTCCAAAPHRDNVATAYQMIYRTVAQFTCMPDVAAFPSVREFMLRARAVCSAPAQPLSVWQSTVLPTLTAHRSVLPVSDIAIPRLGLAMPCFVLFVTINVYAFVFFDRIQCHVAEDAPRADLRLAMIGAMVITGGGDTGAI